MIDNVLAPLSIRDEVAALKRDRIITAAAQLFYANGYENTTLESIAEQLKVTKPFIYAQFNSKGELLAEICARGIAFSQHAMDSVLTLDVTPTEKVAILAKRFVRAVLENRMHIAIFSREEKNLAANDFERINNMRRDFDHKLTEIIKAGIDSGEFTVRDAHLAALAIGGMISWAYVWYRETGRLTLNELTEEFAIFVLNLLGTKRSR